MAATFEMYEGERLIIPYVLTYAATWSVSALQGDPVQQSETGVVYFYIKRREDDTNPVLVLSDDDSDEIEWTGPTTGNLRVKLGNNTAGLANHLAVFELRIKWPDGSFTTVQKGVINIKQSVVDNP